MQCIAIFACMCAWILGMDCGNRAGKRKIRHPISKARLPPSFFAFAWQQQSVCSIQCAVCHQFWESGMRWVSQLHRNTEGQCAVCHHFCGVWDEAGEPATNSFSQSLCCTSNLQSCSAETDCGNRAGCGNFKPLHAGDAAGTFAAIPS
jgi:hypothetical protein